MLNLNSNRRLLIITMLIALIVSGATSIIYQNQKQLQSPAPTTEPVVTSAPVIVTEPTPSPKPTFVNLQDTVDDWAAKNLQKDVRAGVVIYDLDHDQIAGEYNSHTVFNVASIYKLFFAYAGYQEISNGNLNGNKTFLPANGSNPSYSVSRCLDLIVRESYNPCADRFRDNNYYAELVNQLIADLKLEQTSNLGLDSSAYDLAILLRTIYHHNDLNQATSTALFDSMLNQPITTDDWRKGLPSGFSKRVKAYDKVGWNWSDEKWETFADAAIVEFTELNRHYAVVVLTSGVTSKIPMPSINFAKTLEEVIFNQ